MPSLHMEVGCPRKWELELLTPNPMARTPKSLPSLQPSHKPHPLEKPCPSPSPRVGLGLGLSLTTVLLYQVRQHSLLKTVLQFNVQTYCLYWKQVIVTPEVCIQAGDDNSNHINKLSNLFCYEPVIQYVTCQTRDKV